MRPRARRIEAAKVWTAEDAADVLGVPVARVVWLCERAAAAGRAALFFGCWKDGEGWKIPERALRRMMGAAVWQCFTVAEVAELTGFSVSTIRRRLVFVPPGIDPESVRGPGKIAALRVDSDIRIPGLELDRMQRGLWESTGKEEAA